MLNMFLAAMKRPTILFAKNTRRRRRRPWKKCTRTWRRRPFLLDQNAEDDWVADKLEEFELKDEELSFAQLTGRRTRPGL